MDPLICKNIRSRAHPDQRCPHPASSGEYCKTHAKHPRPYVSKSEKAIEQSPNTFLPPVDSLEHIRKIQRWSRFYLPIKLRRRQGPVRFIPELCNNQTDFYSMENITDIPKSSLFSFIDGDNMIYGFDVKSLYSLLETSTNIILNPYNRQPFSPQVLIKAKEFISWCRRKRIDTKWSPIEPSTPDQRFHLRVTDIFQKLDQLNYYTNPEWFLKMDIDDHRCFYVELHDIWSHRAGLSNEMRSIIIPPPAKPFRFPVRDIIAQKSIENMRKINLDLINMFVSAAIDKSDRSLAAMYVVTTLTLVNTQCAETYSWLHESAVPGIYQRYRILTTPVNFHALNILNQLIEGYNIPIFALNNPEEQNEDQ